VSPRQWIRDSVRFALTQYVVRAVLLLRGVIGARMLGPEGYGAWNALVLIMDYALSAPFGTQQGLDQTVPARIVQADAARLERAKRAGLFNILVLTLVFSAVVLLYFLRGPHGSILGSWGIAGLLVGLGCSALTSLSNYHLSVLRSHGSMTAVSDWFVLQGVVGSLLGLALIPWLGAWGLLWGWFVGNLVALAQVRWRGRALVPMVPRPSRDSVELLRAGLPIFFFNSTHLVMRSLDRLIILRLLGTLELGYYSLSIMVLSLLMYLPDSLIYVVYPQLVSAYHAAGNDPRAIRERVLRLLTVISVAVPALSGLAYLCAREAVLVLLPRFLEGVGAVRVLCFGGTGLAIVGVGALALMSVGRQLRLVPAALAFVALGATLDVLALRAGYGIVGVAWATLLTYLGQGALFLWLALGVLRVPALQRIGSITRAFTPFGIAIVLAVLLDRYLPWHHVRSGPWPWLRLALALGVFAGAYAAAVSPLLRGLGLRQILSELRPAGRSPHAESHVD
jgi:O-antigen/teichoic acid export membrane protein